MPDFYRRKFDPVLGDQSLECATSTQLLGRRTGDHQIEDFAPAGREVRHLVVHTKNDVTHGSVLAQAR